MMLSMAGNTRNLRKRKSLPVSPTSPAPVKRVRKDDNSNGRNQKRKAGDAVEMSPVPFKRTKREYIADDADDADNGDDTEIAAQNNTPKLSLYERFEAKISDNSHGTPLFKPSPAEVIEIDNYRGETIEDVVDGEKITCANPVAHSYLTKGSLSYEEYQRRWYQVHTFEMDRAWQKLRDGYEFQERRELGWLQRRKQKIDDAEEEDRQADEEMEDGQVCH